MWSSEHFCLTSSIQAFALYPRTILPTFQSSWWRCQPDSFRDGQWLRGTDVVPLSPHAEVHKPSCSWVLTWKRDIPNSNGHRFFCFSCVVSYREVVAQSGTKEVPHFSHISPLYVLYFLCVKNLTIIWWLAIFLCDVTSSFFPSIYHPLPKLLQNISLPPKFETNFHRSFNNDFSLCLASNVFRMPASTRYTSVIISLLTTVNIREQIPFFPNHCRIIHHIYPNKLQLHM